jgi:hypothetical protein
MKSNPTQLTIRNVNKTLRLSIPADYAKQHGLQAGDHVAWIERPDGVLLKFIKMAQFLKMASEKPR